jgi:menaquinone-dependent protoporphyrinogen oxidase
MDTKVLVVYASTHGSTQEVAEVVAGTLREHELTVDLQRVRDIRKLEGYSAVVLGAPLYMFHLHKDALCFFSQHKEALTKGIPIAIFAGGSIESENENERQEVRKQLDRELAKFPWLNPLAVEVVGGKFDPTRLRFPWNLIPALRQMPFKDLRDWEAIRAWAGCLVPRLQPVMP